MKKVSREETFSEHLKNIRHQQEKSHFLKTLTDFLKKLQLLFLKDQKIKEIENLQKIIAEKDNAIEVFKENAAATEEKLEALEQDNALLEKRVKSLLHDIDIEDIFKIKGQAEKYKNIVPLINTINNNYKKLNELSRRQMIKKKIENLNRELEEAVDDFQKRKIYKNFFQQFTKIPEIEEKAAQIIKDKELLKNKEFIETVMEELKTLTGNEDDFERYIQQEHQKISNALNKIYTIIE